MAQPLTLFELFGEADIAAAVARWPQIVQPVTGLIANWPPPEFEQWLSDLNNGVEVSDVRTGATGDRVAVEAKLSMTTITTYLEGFPFVISSMPDVEFRVQYATPVENQILLLASMTPAGGVELVLERVPVEIRLPPGLIDPHPEPGNGVLPDAPSFEIGSFQVGRLDDLKILYRRNGPTSVFVHARFHVTEEGDVDIRTAVPISFGRCVFSGIPCLALHDFQLIPSPNVARRNTHWLRHEVTPWAPQITEPIDACFSIRSVHIDPDTEPIQDLARWLNDHQTETEESAATVSPPPPPPLGAGDTHAEFVLNDLVVPFFSPWVLPIPRHVTVGIRRRVLDQVDLTQSYQFDTAPVRLNLSAEPHIALIINSLFFRSMPSDVGITFDMAIAFGSTHNDAGESQAVALGIALEEAYTLVASYRRDIDTTTGLPVIRPATGNSTVDDALETFNRLLHAEIATITLDVLTLRFGVSLGRLIGEKKSFGDSFEITGDLFIHMPASGTTTGSFPLGLRSLNGEPVKVIAEAVGRRFGSASMGGLELPDGVVLVVGPFGLVIQELGLTAEDGATYLMISGGVQIAWPSGWSGTFLLKRLRVKFRGPESAPEFKLDGFFLNIKTDAFYVEVAGYYSVTRTPELTREEIGLTGTIAFEVSGKEWGLSIDFLRGHVTTASEDFTYLFAQMVLRGSIPIFSVELVSIRALYANNMKPLLQPVDRESRDLRYYRWYRESDPLTVPGNRRLASWESRNDSMAFGAGFSISFAGLGDKVFLAAFVLYLSGPDERGVLIAVEVRLGRNPNPIGYLALEFDFANGRWSGVLGVALRLENFVESAPDWLSSIGQLTGTLFVGNDPPTFAIGRLNDQRTWLGLRFDWDWWATIKAEFIMCLELVEDGPNGFGAAIRLAGGFKAGRIEATYSAGFGFSVAVFTTTSSDFAIVIRIEFAFRVRVFGFLRFGISAGATLRSVGADPSRGELRVELRFETPWFLPDVTWTWDLTFGQLAPADLATSTSPLRVASAAESGQRSLAIHVEHFDQSFANDRASRPFSINELQAGGPSEATRLANFAANPDAPPIATDSTIGVDWAVPINDQLGLGTGLATGLGNQNSGDLDLTYDLIGLAVRRRARFGPDTAWHTVDERLELPPDFSDPDGVQLTGSFDPQVISAQWDTDLRIAGQPAPKRLLINSSTPFQYITADAEADEELIKNNPTWPCCHERHKTKTFRVHVLSFAPEPLGTDIVGPHRYSDSTSTFRFTRAAVAAPHAIGSTLPPGTIVARLTGMAPGVIARLTFDEDVAYCGIKMAWRASAGGIALLAFDADGNVVGTRTVPLYTSSDFQVVHVGGSAPIRRVELRYIPGGTTASLGVSAAISVGHGDILLEVEGSVYVALRDFLDWGTAKTCDDATGGAGNGYEGRGKVFFLPNHEYEVALTTRVAIDHPTTSPESADVTEYLYFRSKGLPGLNAVDRVGAELEPYVRGAYAGGRGLLYREEPIVLAFDEDFSIALPLSLRPPGSASEQVQLERMQLVVRPEVALTASTPFTTTSEDWIVAHRTTPVGVLGIWKEVVSTGVTLGTPFNSTSPVRARLAELTQRPHVTCDLDDPRDVWGAVLVAPPQGIPDPENPGQELWPAANPHVASVRLEAAPFTHRPVFDPADLTALDFATESGGDAGAWSVNAGTLTAPGGSVRRYAMFGEDDWNHVKVSVLLTLSGTSAGVALALPGSGTPSQCILAYIETTSSGRRLVLARRTGGSTPVELAHAVLDSPSDPAAPLSLHVWGFDDVIRAAVGEQTIEAQRGALREGRLGLVATGGAGFRELEVTGLELFNFPVATSRYRSFNEQVLSWSSAVHDVLPNSLGPGTTTQTVATLWANTQAEVTAAMQPTAPPESRDTVFGRWITGLGLPLRQEVDRLEVTRFDVGGRTQCLLLESREPVDFTEEVMVTLERRVTTPSPSPPFDLEDFFATLDEFPGERSPPLPPGPGPQPGRQPLDIVGGLLRADAARGVPSGPGVSPPEWADIMSVHRHPRGIDVSIDPATVPGDLTGQRAFLLERVDRGDEPMRLRVYGGHVEADPRGRRVTIRATETDRATILDPEMSVLTSRFGTYIERGTVVGVILGPSGGIVMGGYTTTWESVELNVVQDGSGRRAILLPVSSGSAFELPPGTYRMTLEMERARWDTTDAVDDLNHYRDSAQIILML